MLIGKKGTFTLLPPFNQYSATGLLGSIVAVSYIKHMVSTGTNAKKKVYTPVNFESQYKTDYDKNVIIVTIKTANGKKYDIPDIYIPNLYDNDLNLINAYLTVKVGELPRSYNYSIIKEKIAKSVTEASGLVVATKDIYVSGQDANKIITREQADALEALRKGNITNSDSSASEILKLVGENDVLKGKLSSLEKSIVGGDE